MGRIIFILAISFNISFSGMPVTDPTSYTFYIQQIKQSVELINNISKQIATLGGIRTAIDEQKRAFYNAKDALENSVNSVVDAVEDLKETTSNAEIKSLFSLKRDSIKTNSQDGFLYGDITNLIDGYFKRADDAIIEAHGGKEAFEKFNKEYKKIVDVMGANSTKEIKEILNDGKKIENAKNSLLLNDYVQAMQGEGREAIQQLALGQVNKTWKKYFTPTKEQEEKNKQRAERIENIAKYINDSSDMYQQAQTTNHLLFELYKLTMEEHKSAIEFRNAMALLYYTNSDDQQLIKILEERQKNIERINNGMKPKPLSNTWDKIPNGSVFGFGHRPWQK